MFLEMFKAKIHRATVTESELHYEGSVTVDEDLLDAANILVHEKVQVLNINNGERFETYAIKAKRGSGKICINGAGARKVQVGDLIIIIAYIYMSPEEAKKHSATVIIPDENNKIIENYQVKG
ncbi:MAG: aspartate 1-decarboxylase [Mariprofundales bacterium]